MKRILAILRTKREINIGGYTLQSFGNQIDVRHPRSLTSPAYPCSLRGLRAALAWMDVQQYQDDEPLQD